MLPLHCLAPCLCCDQQKIRDASVVALDILCLQEKKERQRTGALEGGEAPAKRPRLAEGGLAGQALPTPAYMQPNDAPMPAASFAGQQISMHQVLSGAASVRAAELSGVVGCVLWQQCLSRQSVLLADDCGGRWGLPHAYGKLWDICKVVQDTAGPDASSTVTKVPKCSASCADSVNKRADRPPSPPCSPKAVHLVGQAAFHAAMQAPSNAVQAPRNVFLPPQLADEATPEPELFQVCAHKAHSCSSSCMHAMCNSGAECSVSLPSGARNAGCPGSQERHGFPGGICSRPHS